MLAPEEEAIFCGKCSCVRPCGTTVRSMSEPTQASLQEDSIQMLIWRAIQKKLRPFWNSKK